MYVHHTHHRFLYFLLVGACPLSAQVFPIPQNSLVRIKPFEGSLLYGCASLRKVGSVIASGAVAGREVPATTLQNANDTATAILFRLRKPTASGSYRTRDCVTEDATIPVSRLESIEIGQYERNLGRAVTQGALIGGALGGAAFWSLGNSTKKCSHCFINTPVDWIVSGSIAGGLLASAVRSVSPRLGWVSLKGPAGSTERATGGWQWVLEKAKLEATAGAGFAGIRVGEVLRTDSTAGGYIPVRNYRYDWRPAVSTGIVSYVFSSAASTLGAGIGVQIVSLPSTEGKAFPFPAITIHVGTPQTEFFAGLVLSPTDSVHVPTNGSGPIRQPYTVNPDNFVFRNTRTSRHVYIGIQVKGTRKSISDIGIPETARLLIDVDTTVTVGDSVRLSAHLADSSGNTLAGPPVQFSVAYGYGRIIDNRRLVADSSGIVVVRAKIGTKEKDIGIVFQPRKAQPSDQKTPPATTGFGEARRRFGLVPLPHQSPVSLVRSSLP